MELHVFPTVAEVLHGLASYFVLTARQAIAARGRFAVALSGGSSPKALYELLASTEFSSQVEWSKVFFFFGDERYVPPSDSDSNYLMAYTALLAPLHIKPAQVFAVPTHLPPTQAAEQYMGTISQYFCAEPARFDLVLLGLGADAHTASLFPHTPVLHESQSNVQSVFLEDKQVYRITMTAPLLNQGQAVAFLVLGEDKAAAVAHVLQDPQNTEEFPAQLIAPASQQLHWFLDTAAALKLQPTL